jgi:drug/metabolite transporter (DMT)-like permease
MLLAPRMLGERLARRDLWLALALGSGLALFFLGVEPAQATAPAPLAGNLLASAAGLAWSFTLIGLRWLARFDEGGNGPAVIAGNLLAFVACLPFALPLDSGGALDLLLILHLGVLQIGLAYLLLTVGLRRVPALEAALLLLCEPVLSAILAWLVHGETLGGFSLLGGGLILAATVARSLAGLRPPRSPAFL